MKYTQADVDRIVAQEGYAIASQMGRNQDALSESVVNQAGGTGHVSVDRVPLEAEEQAAYVAWAAAHEDEYPGLDLLHAIPNGEYRPNKTGANLKAQGVRPGVPDLFVSAPIEYEVGPEWWEWYHGLYIEMKRADRRLSRVSPAQADIIERLREQGYYVAVCYGCAEAIEATEKYFRDEL